MNTITTEESEAHASAHGSDASIEAGAFLFDAIEMAKIGRKWNGGPVAERLWRRHELTLAECRRRGRRFLPMQCLRSTFAREGVA